MPRRTFFIRHTSCISDLGKTVQSQSHIFVRPCWRQNYQFMAAQAPKNSSITVQTGRRLCGSHETPMCESSSTKRSNTRKDTKTKDSWMLKGTGKLLKSVTSSGLQSSSTEVSSAAGFELLCTYNWASSALPTIYVPGIPPKWKSPKLPTNIKKDTGFQFVDQNAFRAPRFPFEPIFRALSVMNPTADFSDVDIVTNRNSLRNLLGFSQGRVESSFRIDLNTIHDTLFLTRHEKNSRIRIGGLMHQGFGHNFERACTEPPYLNSCGHHRIIRYLLGDLDCVVRFEVDAFYDGDEIRSDDDDEGGVPLTIRNEPHPGETKNDSNILPHIGNLSISSPRQEKDETAVIGGGRYLLCSKMAEIKTKSKVAPKITKYLPQLWFGRVPHLLLGIHENGIFKRVEQTNIQEHFAKFESKQQDNLCKMTRLISELREVTKTAGGACVLVCDHRSKPLMLQMFAASAHATVLPDAFVDQYWKNETRRDTV